jgi:rhamnogalacturonyl hydrolase YesR
MILTAAVAAILSSQAPTKADLSAWGRETIEMVRAVYYMPDRKLYGDSVIPGKAPEQVAFNWGCGVLLSALNAAAQADAKYIPWLREFADTSHTYWNPEGPVPGYDVLPGPKSADRYYDDNEWMVLALVETYRQVHDPKYLRWAQNALRFVLSGEDDQLGGGIFWKEREKASKNTCSNAPAAAACLAVYRETKNVELLEKARSLYRWTKKNLQDPSDHLMGDSIDLSGKKNMTKWSYNTALMIRTAAELYRLTGQDGYRLDALAMAESSVSHWLRGGMFHDGGRFAHLLLESWLILDRDVPGAAIPREGMAAALAYLHNQARSPLGFYPNRWNSGPPAATDRLEMIDQASVARADFELAHG